MGSPGTKTAMGLLQVGGRCADVFYVTNGTSIWVVA
jgi:hypothetical protein